MEFWQGWHLVNYIVYSSVIEGREREDFSIESLKSPEAVCLLFSFWFVCRRCALIPIKQCVNNRGALCARISDFSLVCA